MKRRTPRRRALRILLGVAIVLVLLAGTAFAILRVEFEGPKLGNTIASLLNKRMRGRIQIGSIEWDSSSLKQAIAGGWVPLRVHDVKIWDDCAFVPTGGTEFRTTDPNEDCTPDDHPDPDPASKRMPRKLLVSTPLVTGEIDLHALMFGNHDYVFRAIHVRGGEVLLEQTREPYPLHAYDRTITSIISAFYPRMKPGFRAGIYADTPPPVFELRDIHMHDLNVTAHFSPGGGKKPGEVAYSMTMRLEHVDIDPSDTAPKNDAYLFNDGTDPLVAKFYVRLAIHAKQGWLGIQDNGPRDAFKIPEPGAVYPPEARHQRYQLHLTDVDLSRLAQLPSEWSRHDYIANTLELALTAKTRPCPTDPDDPFHYTDADGATLQLTGDLEKYWDRPYDGTWDLRLVGDNLGPTIRSCIKSKIGGEHLKGTVTLTGPFVASPKLTADLENLDVDLPLKKDTDPIHLTLAEVHGGIDLVNEQGYVEKTKGLVAGGKEPGEVDVSATFGFKPYNANAVVEIPKAIDIGRFLTERIRTSVGKYLSGRMSAKGDVDEGFALEDFDLALGDTPTSKVIRAFHGRLFTENNFGKIQIEDVEVEAGQSHAKFDGWVDTKQETQDITIDGHFPDLATWLRRFGLPQLATSANGTIIHLTGKVKNPTVTARTTLAGVPCIETLRLDDVQIVGNMVDVRAMSTPGLGGKIGGTARLRLGANGAPPYIEKLHLTGGGLDAARLCGSKGMVKGALDVVEVDLHGALDRNRPALDWLPLANAYVASKDLAIKGEHVEHVAACLNSGDDARCRPRGIAYLDADDRAQCDDAKKQTSSGGFCLVASATRPSGGALDATIAKLPGTPASRGKPAVPSHIGGTLAVGDVPLAIVDQFLADEAAAKAPPQKGAAQEEPAIEKPIRYGGFAAAMLHLSGTLDAPRATGTVDVIRAWALNAFLGDAHLDVAPTVLAAKKNMPALAIHGTALAGRVEIDGTIGTVAPYPVELALRGHAVEVDQFVDLQAILGVQEAVQAWASGAVTITTELAPLDHKKPAPEAWVELSDARFVVHRRGTDGRLIPVQLAAAAPELVVPGDREAPGDAAKDPVIPNRPAVSLHVTPDSIELACRDPKSPTGRTPCPTKIDARPLGAPGFALVAALRGKLTSQLAEITANGQIQFSQLTPLLDQRFDEVAGTAKLTAGVVGTIKAPKVEAAVELDHVLIRPTGGDTVLEAPGGLIKFANSSLAFGGVTVTVRDEHRDDSQGALEIHGGLTFDGLTPKAWGVFVTGKLAAKALAVIAPNTVSQASGVATIGEDGIRFYGKGQRPLVAGSLAFDASAPVTLLPRGVRRELSFARGTIEVTTCGNGLPLEDQDSACANGTQAQIFDSHRIYRIEAEDIGGKIDNEGLLTNVSGSVVLRDNGEAGLDVAGADIGIDADSIPFRIPGTLDLVLALKGIDLRLENERWRASGTISLVNGVYKTNFDLADRITKIGSNAPPAKPFWEEYPALGNADLNLTLDVRKFTVDNNVATIDMAGKDIEISQTPRDPRLSGSITVVQGRFRIPGTRADFTNTHGSVDFSENQRAANPRLDVTSEANYRDLSGQEHLITMAISGTLEQPQWDLHTSTGYNKSQTLSLLVLGRNQESLRRSLGDQSLGTDPLHVDPTTNPSSGFADQIVKDLAGDWVSSLIGGSLTALTGLDVLRFDIGFGSVGIHVEKKIATTAKLIGDAETTIRGSTLNGRAELKTPWRGGGLVNVSLQAGYLKKDYIDPAEQDITDGSLKLVVRLFIP